MGYLEVTGLPWGLGAKRSLKENQRRQKQRLFKSKQTKKKVKYICVHINRSNLNSSTIMFPTATMNTKSSEKQSGGLCNLLKFSQLQLSKLFYLHCWLALNAALSPGVRLPDWFRAHLRLKRSCYTSAMPVEFILTKADIKQCIQLKNCKTARPRRM